MINSDFHPNADLTTLAPASERVVATSLKNGYTLRLINEMFEIAEADPSWKIEPAVDESDGVRVTLALSWLQGIRRNAPDQHLRICISVMDQMLANPNEMTKDDIRRLRLVRSRAAELQSLARDAADFNSAQSVRGDTPQPGRNYSFDTLEAVDHPAMSELGSRIHTLRESVLNGPDLDPRVDAVYRRFSSIWPETMNPNQWRLYQKNLKDLSVLFRDQTVWDHRNADYISPNYSYLQESIDQLKEMVNSISGEEFGRLQQEYVSMRAERRLRSSMTKPKVFLAHGRSHAYARIQSYLNNELSVDTVTFETESRTAQQITEILEDMVHESTVALVVMTAEDRLERGGMRARQNVIHEIGLFQGRLGFGHVAILKESNAEPFSNMSGVIYIPFDSERVENSFYDVRRFLQRMNVTN